MGGWQLGDVKCAASTPDSGLLAFEKKSLGKICYPSRRLTELARHLVKHAVTTTFTTPGASVRETESKRNSRENR
ncbi:hypothetical protein Psta_0213 [Pirellula staleyi DSM 6068]|uniref:Uncharacterized protein n=1 Tax=Pirellula staleyi (strain ATCC 27377 / DSM 6068 / ICPB 4128) TaxID=530564 RepID=D2R1C4_PIRSD|nr:hypothetical protein Psta_0213 [Pirellula staleyi DSM 6068]